MEKLVDAGLCKNIGLSNHEIKDIRAIQKVAKKPIAVNQFETQPYYQRNPLVNYCSKHGIVVTAHTSLGSPGNVMSSKHKSAPLMQDALINKIAAKKGKTPAQILLRWALQRPTIVIPKSVTASRI
jgi:aldehyde reductase